MPPRRLAVVAALAAVLATAPRALAQCAMCGNSFEPNDPATTAFNASVLFMMLAPYSIFFAAVGCLVWLHRRSARGRRATVIALPRRPARPERPQEVTP